MTEYHPQSSGNGIEDNLDDSPMPEVNFAGGTLSLNGAEPPIYNECQKPMIPPTNQPVGGPDNGNYLRGRPQSAPVPPVVQHGFYASKAGRFEEAVIECKKETIKDDVDGAVLGAWLLTEIDHWDIERERLAVLTENSLYLVRYDFVGSHVRDFRRLNHVAVQTIQIGVFSYPEKSIVSPRDGIGMRIIWSKDRKPSFMERWNPFCSTIPWWTLTSHPLEHSDNREAESFGIESFKDAHIQAINRWRLKQNQALSNAPTVPVPIIKASISCDVLLGVSATVHNQSRLGFNRERGGVSF